MTTQAASPRSSTIYSIQILRGLAALVVVLRHIAKEVSSNPFGVGQIGVDIFFVISGFVIYLTAPKMPAAEFALRRFLRVVPLYWLFLGLTIAADVLRHRTDPDFALPNALFSFFFIPSHDHAGSMFPPLVVGWSLNYEAFFYVVAGVVLATMPHRRFLRGLTDVIVAAVALGFAVRMFVEPSSAPVTILLLPITLEFLAGAWLAHWWSEGGRIPPLVGGMLVVGAIAWLAVAPVQTPYTLERAFEWGIPALAIVAGLLAFEDRLAGLWPRPLLLLGDASYSLYLAHPIVIGVILAVLGSRLSAVPPLAIIVLVAGLSTIAGFATHFLLERPLLKVTRHIRARRR